MADSDSRPRLNGPLGVAAVELDVAHADKKANLDAAASAVAALGGGVDVVLLPEMFSTGYILEPTLARRLAEPSDGPTIDWAAQLAARCNCAIAGTFIALDHDGHLFNRAFFTEPSGETAYYDKRHLFAPGGEDRTYTPGHTRSPIVRFRGWNVAMAVCYDLRFPVWLRNVGLAYDLLLVAANWPDARKYAWCQLLLARAIENQAYVVGCNRSGSDEGGKYSGSSLIADPRGVVVSTEAHTPDGTRYVAATLMRSSVDDMRSKLPVALSADRFTLE